MSDRTLLTISLAETPEGIVIHDHMNNLGWGGLSNPDRVRSAFELRRLADSLEAMIPSAQILHAPMPKRKRVTDVLPEQPEPEPTADWRQERGLA